MKQSHQETLEKVENLISLTRAKSFLGHEFLTWLWFVCESGEEWVEVVSPATGEKSKVSVWIDDRIVLESASDQHIYTLKGGSPSQSLEASAALRTGKSVKEMKVGFKIHEFGEFLCTLNAADLSPRGLRIPELEVDETTETDSIIEHKLMSCEAFTTALDALFLKFLNERIENDWEKGGLSNIKSWMKKRTQGLEGKLLH